VPGLAHKRIVKASPRLKKRKPVGWDDELWELRLAELIDFKEKYGHVGVLVNWRKNLALGRWLAYQRQQSRRGEIEPELCRW
jgi:hypothetical protein